MSTSRAEIPDGVKLSEMKEPRHYVRLKNSGRTAFYKVPSKTN